MWFKIFGSLIILGASTMIGFSMANRKIERAKELKIIESALNMLAIEINFSMKMIYEIFEKIGLNLNNRIGEIFLYSSKLMTSENITARKAFKEALEYVYPVLNINRQDKEIFAETAISLGELDAESQLKNINLIIEQLKFQQSEAEDEKMKYGKMYKSMGAIIGIGIVIVIL